MILLLVFAHSDQGFCCLHTELHVLYIVQYIKDTFWCILYADGHKIHPLYITAISSVHQQCQHQDVPVIWNARMMPYLLLVCIILIP